MPLSPDDPWYVPPGHPHYKRALALSEMRYYIEVAERASESMQRRRAPAVADRRRCLENWQGYLDGTVAMRTGRRPTPDEHKHVKLHISLPPSLYERVLELRRDGESESALVARLLEAATE